MSAMTVLTQSIWAVDITINDTMNSGGVYGTDSRVGIREDGEVEPRNLTGQVWDLEAFVVQNQKLYLIGGFNFLNGQSGNGMTFRSGDLFIDNNNNALWGAGSPTLSGGDGYRILNNRVYQFNYVIDLSFPSYAYNVYELDESASTADRMRSVYYRENDESNPWEYLGEQSGTSITKPTTPNIKISGLR